MAEPRLDALPKELIALIASYSDARTTLSLVRTCRRVATACNNTIVFRDILLNSQATNWPEGQLDLDAIATRCGQDVSAWARYAVADQVAAESTSEHPFVSWERYRPWLPQLLITNHPFASQKCWREKLPTTSDVVSTAQGFCFAQAVIAGEETTRRPTKHWDVDLEEKDPNLDPDNSLRGALREFLRVFLIINNHLRNRRNAWPYNDEALVPYVPLPSMHELRIGRPINPGYSLPLPYETGYDQWYADHTRAMVEDPDFFTSGTWRGYYSYSDFFMSSHMLDPPMMDIKFRRVEGTAAGYTQFIGEHGFDGEGGPFRVSLMVSNRGDGFEIRGSKKYSSGMAARWDWDLKLTPLGLIGWWGQLQRTSFSRKGFLWLWKAGQAETSEERETDSIHV